MIGSSAGRSPIEGEGDIVDGSGGPCLPEDEDVLADIVEEAARPYDHLLTAEDRHFMREALADAFVTHPRTAALLEQLSPQADTPTRLEDRTQTSGKGDA